MDKRVVDWHKMQSYIKKRGIKYKGKKGEQVPDFSTVAKNENELERMEIIYNKKWTDYIVAVLEEVGGEIIDES
jgi:hypothetical protein